MYRLLLAGTALATIAQPLAAQIDTAVLVTVADGAAVKFDDNNDVTTGGKIAISSASDASVTRTRSLDGDGSYKIAGEVGLEEQFGQIGYSLRGSLRFGW